MVTTISGFCPFQIMIVLCKNKIKIHLALVPGPPSFFADRASTVTCFPNLGIGTKLLLNKIWTLIHLFVLLFPDVKSLFLNYRFSCFRICCQLAISEFAYVPPPGGEGVGSHIKRTAELDVPLGQGNVLLFRVKKAAFAPQNFRQVLRYLKSVLSLNNFFS